MKHHFLALFFILSTHIKAQELNIHGSIGFGSINVINPSHYGLKGFNNQISLGAEKALNCKERFFIDFNLIYGRFCINDYLNSPYYYHLQKKIPVKTSIVYQSLTSQVVFRHRLEESRFSFGIGMNLSMILNADLKQSIEYKFDSTEAPFVKSNFDYNTRNGVHKMLRFNVAPIFEISYDFSSKFGISYYSSVDLFQPNQLFVPFETYRVWNNVLVLNYKFKPKK